MNNQRPVVSIVLATYNGEKHIRESIASCLKQTLNDFELIIVNDCSIDRTPEIIEQFAQNDPRIRLVHNKINKKLPASLNIGFSMASGKYHTWTSDDNAYAPTALEEMVNFLEHRPLTDVVYCDYVKVDERTRHTREWIVKDIDYIGRGNPVGACFMYRPEVFEKLNGYNENLFCVEDYDFWLRAFRHGFKFTPLRKILYFYRCHENSLTETKKEKIREMTSKLNEDHFRILNETKKNTVLCDKVSHLIKSLNTPFVPEKRVAIWGWWQGRNLGDNWIKDTLREFFQGAIFIDTHQRDFRKYGFVICGGGGLFIRGIIAPWDGPVHTPFGVLGLGAEFRHSDNKAYELSKKADFFYLRDEYSVACMKTPETTRSYDLTFAKPLSINRMPDFNRILFVWRDPEELTAYPDFHRYIGHTEPHSVWHEKISGEFTQIDEDNFNTRRSNIDKLVSDSGFVISARYHGVVAAIQKAIPCIGIDVCPKIRSLMKEVGLEEYCLKVGETGAIRHAVRKAKKEYLNIRKKQLAYRQKAHETVLTHINSCVVAVNKRLREGSNTVSAKPGFRVNDNCMSTVLTEA